MYNHARGRSPAFFSFVIKHFGYYGLFVTPFVALAMEKSFYDTCACPFHLSCSCMHDKEQRTASRTSRIPACALVSLLCCIVCRADDDRTRTRVPALCLRGIDPNKRADERQGEGFPSGGHTLPSLSLVPLRENGFTLGDILPSSLSPFDTSRPQR